MTHPYTDIARAHGETYYRLFKRDGLSADALRLAQAEVNKAFNAGMTNGPSIPAAKLDDGKIVQIRTKR